MKSAVKTFHVSEGSTEFMWYEIIVRYGSKEVDRFLRPTMREARDAFTAAGYKEAA